MLPIDQVSPLTEKHYNALLKQWQTSPEAFWKAQSDAFLTWDKPWQNLQNCDWSTGQIRWFEGGQINACAQMIDRHLPDKADKTALIWQPESPDAPVKTYTYQNLYHEVCTMSRTLKAMGVKKGDRVGIYLPMIPECAFAVLACARIGAVHTVIFSGFSAQALAKRCEEAECDILITADGALRNGQPILLKAIVQEALTHYPQISQVLVIPHLGLSDAPKDVCRDRCYQTLSKRFQGPCDYEPMEAEDPLFILYTSGSTGRPKGVLHTHGGYLLQVAMTFRWAFDYQASDVYWTTADIGWVTGHSYGLYGPLMNGATLLWYEGGPMSPTPARFWEIIDQHQVSIFYTAPTALRALKAQGNQWLDTTSRDSLRILGSVGEPLDEDTRQWFQNQVSTCQAPVVDTWWQTETGAIMIATWPLMQSKGYPQAKPMLGVSPVLKEGVLLIESSWPSQARTLYAHPERFISTYLTPYPDYYYTGDGALYDKKTGWKVTGRIDDVINVSGHRLGTGELESVCDAVKGVKETAIVGIPDNITGETLVAFVIADKTCSEKDIKTQLNAALKTHIGKIAQIKTVKICADLPKTRSGKIMRRLLKQVMIDPKAPLGDLSTLSNPESMAPWVSEKNLA